jgi:MATE family multidrug resistance protein
MQLDKHAAGRRSVSNRDLLAIAVPIVLSNATTPLIGFFDTVVVGRLGQAHLIGAVAVAANIFNTLYWTFGFLRMGTTGLTAQAVGARNEPEVAANLMRALLIAGIGGLAMIAAQSLIAYLAFLVMGASQDVEQGARVYFQIRIFSAPAGLMNFALLGWFIGLGNAALAFWLQLLLNGINILLAVVLVLGLDLGVPGVALAAFTAEWIAAIAGLLVAFAALRRRGGRAPLGQVLDLERLKRALAVNGDIMIRTVALLLAMVFFTAQGAQSGDTILAANAVLFSIAMVATYLLDGFAFAAETLVGQAIGARLLPRFREAVYLSTIWAGAFGLTLTLAIWTLGPLIIDFMTTSPEVREAARVYLPWAALMPVVGVWCFQLDGIFIGAARTADMRNMMLLSLAVFFAAWACLQPLFANHGLWAALLIFNTARAITLLSRFPALERAAFRVTR